MCPSFYAVPKSYFLFNILSLVLLIPPPITFLSFPALSPLYFPFQSFLALFLPLSVISSRVEKKIYFLKNSGFGYYYFFLKLQLIISRHVDHLGNTHKILNSFPFYLFPSLSSSSCLFLTFPALSSPLVDGQSVDGRMDGWTDARNEILFIRMFISTKIICLFRIQICMEKILFGIQFTIVDGVWIYKMFNSSQKDPWQKLYRITFSAIFP